MNINWIVRQAGWAFGNLCRHILQKMPQHKHSFDASDGDINFVCSPNFFKNRKADSRTILHLDSNRWHEVFIDENKR